MPAPIFAILLAAGQGTRLGGPKALLVVRDGAPDGASVFDAAAPLVHESPLIEAQCRDRLAAESTRALAVLRPDVAALVAARLHQAGAEVVLSHAPDALGPAGSLAAAVAHLASSAAAATSTPDAPTYIALVTPVDVRATPATAAALVRALLASPGSPSSPGSPFSPATAAAAPLAAVPRHAGRRGHPVALTSTALARYLAPDPPPLRDHLRSLGDRVTLVDVDDPFILEDLDFAHQTATLARLTNTSVPTFWR